MSIQLRLTILSLVFVISTVFFWLAINKYLLQSKAQQESDFQVVPHNTKIDCNPEGECWLHLLGSTSEENAIAGISGKVRYGENLTPDRVDALGVCEQSTYELTAEVLQFSDDPEKNIVSFAIGTFKQNDELKGGSGCVATIVFKPVDITKDPQDSTLQLFEETSAGEPETSSTWLAGGILKGIVGTFVVNLDNTIIDVNISSDVQWPPEGVPTSTPSLTETVTPTLPHPTIPPEECRDTEGDCNCDGNIDLIDWEAIRVYEHNEGEGCSVDREIWLMNNDLVISDLFMKDNNKK